MYRWGLVLVVFTLLSCSSGPIAQTCPDGEPVNILRNVEEVYPVYAREYEANFNVAANQLGKIASDVQAGATIKVNAVRLRQELDQERSALQEQQKTVVVALQTTPCDKEIRKKAMDLLVDVKSKANRIPDRLKEFTEQGSIKLQSEVSNLLRYPDASRDIANPPTVLEASMVNKLPRRLFDLLYTYNDAAILNVPNVGAALRDHKIAYYGFRQRVTQLEASLMLRIGEMVKVRFSQGWNIYLQYLVMRFGGTSQAQIVAGHNFLNYEITWDDCERVFSELSKDKSIPNSFSETFTLHHSLAQGVSKIASAI